MWNNDDREYFRRRELEERERAAKAPSSAKHVHVELADRYAELLKQPGGDRSKSWAAQA